MTRIDVPGFTRPLRMTPPAARPVVASVAPMFGRSEEDRKTDAHIIKLGLLRALIPLGVLVGALTAAAIFGRKNHTPPQDPPPAKAGRLPFTPDAHK